MIYSSGDIESNRLKLIIMSHLLPFDTAPKNPKNQNFGAMKKLLEISSFHTCVPKKHNHRGTVPEIRSKTDITSCHFGPFFAL